jgi:hypothetical protein
MGVFSNKWWNRSIVIMHTNFDSEHLSKLGLKCDMSNNNKFFIYNVDRTFTLSLHKYDYNKIETIYNNFLRKQKIQKISKSNIVKFI